MFVGEKEVESLKQQVAVAKRHAESVAILTPELGQAFIEVCLSFVKYDVLVNFISHWKTVHVYVFASGHLTFGRSAPM